MRLSHAAGASLAVVLLTSFATAQREFGFDNRKPSGQDYLTAQESVRRFTVADGYTPTVFASEPDVINPVAFTVDERGRLWVVECFEYPRRTPPGQKPRDRIKILEDTNGDGKADKVTIFAEGKDFPIPPGRTTAFDLATGIEVGHGGVFLGAAPYLWFLRDTDGDGKCDQFEILKSGFGSQDTHETLNTFTWGPEGRLYGLHGVFTHSQVDGVKMNAAVWRYDVRAKRFEIFGEGTSNPWGLDFDARGNCFLCCCVIPHLFHISPGGLYKRQAGQSFHPHAYGLLNEICDHTHHKESGWAHAGLLVLEGEHVPEALRGSVIMGSIHGCSIKRNRLERNRSTFVGRRAPDFLTSGDKNLRPINLRWGPDDSIYLIDWHDQNPCHQAPADSWDLTRGRIYKFARTGQKPTPPGNLAGRSSKELIELLQRSNPWWHRTASRLLAERRDPASLAPLRAMAESAEELPALRGLWTLAAMDRLDAAICVKQLGHPAPAVRHWAVRLLGEREKLEARILARLTELAKSEPAAEVRLQLASTAQRLEPSAAWSMVRNLLAHSSDADDPCLPLMTWLALEPSVATDPAPVLAWLTEHSTDNSLATDAIVPRALRRLAASGAKADLDRCVDFLARTPQVELRRRALAGMTEALRGRTLEAPKQWAAVLTSLQATDDPEVRRLARTLAITFRDPVAMRQALALARDAERPAAERLAAVRDLALSPLPEARKPLLTLVSGDDEAALRCEACRALAGYDDDDLTRELLAGWKQYPPILRNEVVNLLAGRRGWAGQLLAAVGDRKVSASELSQNVILRIHALRDRSLDAQIHKVWGTIRDTPADLAKLIDRMRGELDAAPGSFARGRTVFENQCAKCHQFEGKGHEVGPPLDGAARDIEYLLANILDPNRVVGQPYFLRLVALKNGRVETGLLAAEDANTLRLKSENGAIKVLSKADIDEVTIQERSMMPEGLASSMSVQDFRDLVRYLMAHPYLSPVQSAAVAFDDRAWPEAELRPAKVGVGGAIPTLPGATALRLRAEVIAPAAGVARLMIETDRKARVRINGQELAAKDGAWPAMLKAGRNVVEVLAEVPTGRRPLRVRFLDPERKLGFPE